MELSPEQKLKMSEYGIPKYMQGGIIRYYEKGIPPGHFLTAVINNDLRGAIERADDQNSHLLKAYTLWFYNQAPQGSWGFDGAVQDWCRKFEDEPA